MRNREGRVRVYPCMGERSILPWMQVWECVGAKHGVTGYRDCGTWDRDR